MNYSQSIAFKNISMLMFKSSCSALYCSLLRVLHFVHFLLNEERSCPTVHMEISLCSLASVSVQRQKKIAAGIPVITNFLLKNEW